MPAGMQRNLFLIVSLTGLCLLGCKRQESATPQPTNASTTTDSGNPITAPVDYLGAVAKAQKSAVKTVDLASLSQAIKLFQVGEERNPASLQELVTQGYLPKLPEPPAGMKFDYDPKTGQVSMVPRQ
jgi:hypothetical protein